MFFLLLTTAVDLPFSTKAANGLPTSPLPRSVCSAQATMNFAASFISVGLESVLGQLIVKPVQRIGKISKRSITILLKVGSCNAYQVIINLSKILLYPAFNVGPLQNLC